MNKLKKALEKTKQARGTDHETFMQEVKRPRPKLSPRVEERTMGRQELQVSYSNTKVEHIDPRVLKKNKVISLFHENEMTDQITILRTQVLNKLKEIGGNSLLVTSANPGEGKTFTAINLGVSIAQELDRSVLLVDADLKKPHKHHYDFADDFFGVDIRKGLSDYLLGQGEIPELLLNPGIPRLTILPGGKSLPNSSELLGSARMESLVFEMKNRYRDDRIVIFDSSSLLLSSDPLVFSRFVDGILLVVEVEKTSPNDLKRVMELLKDNVIIGTVMNKAKGGL